MTLATEVHASVENDHRHRVSYPSGFGSDWKTVCTAPDAVEADAGVVVGGKVVKPGAIERAAQAHYRPGGFGKRLLVALKYNSDVTVPTDPVVVVFGRDRGGVWHRLRDASGAVEHTITVDPAVDVVSDDGTYMVTEPVEVLLDGSEIVIVAVQTAFAGTGTVNDSEIIVKAVGDQ